MSKTRICKYENNGILRFKEERYTQSQDFLVLIRTKKMG